MDTVPAEGMFIAGAVSRSWRWMSRAALLAMAAGMAALFTGFFFYRMDVADFRDNQFDGHADGIVILTGGADRVATGIHLLESGRGQRLLISGVHPDASISAILRHSKLEPALVSCCIDLDRQAMDTRGNAAETADWARKNGFQSLIIVSSAYHLPRSMAEFRAVMPDIVLEANAAGRKSSLRTELKEYAKYSGARLRLFLHGWWR